MDLALNNQQKLICHKTQQSKPTLFQNKKMIILFCIPFLVSYQTFLKHHLMGMIVRVFANGPSDLGSIPVRVIPKTQKWYLIPPCLTLSIISYG